MSIGTLNDGAFAAIGVLPLPEPRSVPRPATPVNKLSVTDADVVPFGTPIASVHVRPLVPAGTQFDEEALMS
jgi:hypothetical protein